MELVEMRASGFDIGKIVSRYEKFVSPNGFLLLTGSIAEGFSNRTSDVDLILVTDYKDDVKRSSENYAIEYLYDRRVEMTVFSLLEFRDYVRQINDKARIKGGMRTGKIISSKPILNPRNYEVELKSFDRDRFLEKRFAFYESYSTSIYEDFEGAIKSSKMNCAGIWARELLVVCAEQLLFSMGDMYEKRKWVVDRFANTVGKLCGSAAINFEKLYCSWSGSYTSLEQYLSDLFIEVWTYKLIIYFKFPFSSYDLLKEELELSGARSFPNNYFYVQLNGLKNYILITNGEAYVADSNDVFLRLLRASLGGVETTNDYALKKFYL
ncbi:nucleotidyltransferase domain-containing protein [Gilvimarinus sp. SDUM040013]|uniref:Nucleotidyltransferase domain-containing protein n=1 Tax=Gilvimarinus gilvus TaxID=3058038 RepID=A0ABU4S3Q4_9GAMM|nr:nucleotidyltransferase domain-containing protein [Gilvimarinus sp. SDUM040013]MDO3386009.1 nucleotidyltransferase domain-containing protein [Gilvimarinus sp. SDUM040013]MDX6850463.1 nucleotidyltransferase domain-containing protein [Gilvimarinus sp. SDUM040013]